MSGYGDVKGEDGKDLAADGYAPTLTGQCVEGNEMISLGYSEGHNGELDQSAAVLKFKQSNGATFQHRITGSDEGWAVDKTKREMLHICSKIVSKEDYLAVIAGSTGFVDFINRINEKVIPQASGKKFSLKLIYKLSKDKTKAFVNFPSFPNFIEQDGTTPSTFSTDPKYDTYEMPTLGAPAVSGAPMPGVADNDAPF